MSLNARSETKPGIRELKKKQKVLRCFSKNLFIVIAARQSIFLKTQILNKNFVFNLNPI